MLTEISRGHVRLLFAGKSVRINGEMLVPNPGGSNFVLFSKSVHWDPPNEHLAMDDETRKQILEEAKRAFVKSGMLAEVE